MNEGSSNHSCCSRIYQVGQYRVLRPSRCALHARSTSGGGRCHSTQFTTWSSTHERHRIAVQRRNADPDLRSATVEAQWGPNRGHARGCLLRSTAGYGSLSGNLQLANALDIRGRGIVLLAMRHRLPSEPNKFASSRDRVFRTAGTKKQLSVILCLTL